MQVANNEVDVRLVPISVNLASKRTNRTTTSHVDQAVGAVVHNIKPIEKGLSQHETSRNNARNHEHKAVAVMPGLRLRVSHDRGNVVELVAKVPCDAAAQRKRTRVLKREADAGTADVRAPVDVPQARVDRERRLHHHSFL